MCEGLGSLVSRRLKGCSHGERAGAKKNYKNNLAERGEGGQSIGVENLRNKQSRGNCGKNRLPRTDDSGSGEAEY